MNKQQYPNSPPPGRRGCLKGGVVGEKYIPYFKEPLPFHLPPPPLGYSSSLEEEN